MVFIILQRSNNVMQKLYSIKPDVLYVNDKINNKKEC